MTIPGRMNVGDMMTTEMNFMSMEIVISVRYPKYEAIVPSTARAIQ